MLSTEFFDLSLSLQVALGAGYLGYVTAYAGFRREHAVADMIFISLAFSSVAMIAFVLLEERGVLWSVPAAFASSIVCAAICRRCGREGWLWVMGALGVHRDDGSHGAWSQIVQTNRSVGQVSVHTADGRTLYLNDRTQYEMAPWDGLYLGGDGSVVMVVEQEELPDGSEETRCGINDDYWGTRMTYIPASQVRRVNIRMK